ncbi:putative membrane protein [Gottschalkia purinilytica]|uniref:Putative membrane protein n=1 Tax=Gottschalkia purinilytica TaxID=1503 RepID=A0A0L0W6G0_GOTPU|nr:DUF6773 family protein [Gottschalkia purinilytica]KNF07109.1 putative membrane protein [Gottschalkia purinilytica]
MRLFNKEKRSTDERIVNVLNKIYKEAYYLVMIMCLISIGVKYYLHGSNIKSIILELLIIFISGIYCGIRKVCLGIYIDEVEIHDRTSKISMSVKNIIIGLVSGIVISVFFGVRNSVLYGNDTNRIWYFILVFFASFMMYCPFFVLIISVPHIISRKLSKKIPPEN